MAGLSFIFRLRVGESADCISGCRKAINSGQKLAEKEPLGQKYTKLIRSHTTMHYQKITCVY